MSFSKPHLNGIRLMIQASASFSIMTLCVKLIGSRLPIFELVFFRSLIGMLMIAFLIRRKKISFLGQHRTKLILRGISGFLALASFFYTIPRLPLGTAVLLNYTAPFFVVILSRIFLREKTTAAVFWLTVLSFTGVYLLLGGQTRIDPAVAFIGLLSAFFAGIAYVTIRSIKHHESPLTVIFYFTLISTLGSAALCLPEFKWPSMIDWLCIAGMAAGAFWGQLWLTIALRRAPAPLAAPFSYLTPLLAFLYGLIFWGETLSAVSLTGVVLILTGGCLVSYLGPKKRN